MKFTDVMFDELKGDQLRSLPREWIAHYLGRPTRDQIDSAKYAMWFRSALIAALFLYIFLTKGSELLAFLGFCLVGYEIAYYTLWKAKVESDYLDRMKIYIAEAKLLPEYHPPRR